MRKTRARNSEKQPTAEKEKERRKKKRKRKQKEKRKKKKEEKKNGVNLPVGGAVHSGRCATATAAKASNKKRSI